MSSDERFIVAVLRALQSCRLEAVIVGNTAAVLQGAPVMTEDVDLLIRDSPKARDKIKAFATALGGVPTRPSDLVDVTTIVGAATTVDIIVGHLSGNLRFESVKSRAHSIPVMTETALVADLADIIRSKEAAGRPKDHAALPTLRSTLAARGHIP